MDLHAAMPFTALLGATATAVAPGEVRLRLDWAPERCTAAGPSSWWTWSCATTPSASSPA